MDGSLWSGIIFSENDVTFCFYTFYNNSHAGEIMLKSVNESVMYECGQIFINKDDLVGWSSA